MQSKQTFNSQRRANITIGFIIVLTLIYILSSLPTLLQIKPGWVILFAQYRPAVLAGEWWRLVTCIFMHQNLGHLGANVFGLFIFGRMLEVGLVQEDRYDDGQKKPLIRKGSYVLLMIISGVGGSLLSFSMWGTHSFSFGASGVVSGLLAAYVTINLMLTRWVIPHLQSDQAAIYRTQFNGQFRGMILVAIAMFFLDKERGNVDYWGHLGGMIGGAGFTLFWLQSQRQRLLEQMIPTTAASNLILQENSFEAPVPIEPEDRNENTPPS